MAASSSLSELRLLSWLFFFFLSLSRHWPGAPCPLRSSRLAAGCCLFRLAFSNRCLSRLAVIQLTAPLGYIHAPGNLWTRDTWYVQVRRHQTGCDLLGGGQKTNNTTHRRLGFFAALFPFHWTFAYIYVVCCYRFAERMGRGLHGRWSQLLHQVSSAGAALQRVAARGGEELMSAPFSSAWSRVKTLWTHVIIWKLFHLLSCCCYPTRRLQSG